MNLRMLKNLAIAVAPPSGFLKATYVTPGVSYGSDLKLGILLHFIHNSSCNTREVNHALVLIILSLPSSDSIVVADLSFSQRLLII
ncbi:hypothetical protein P8452_39803 [Trifolium repens]|nr:hypothetical protein P8452_39803 [Trifolium repens]